MRKIVVKKWSELKPLWDDLFDNSMTATPFQTYEFLTFTGKGKAYRNDLFRLVGLKKLNMVLYLGEKPVAIAPLLYKKKKGKTFVYMRGHFTTANQLDFIYASWEYEDCKFLMDSIKSLFGNVSFLFDRVSEKTTTYHYLKEYFDSDQIEDRECFAIPITENYNEWFSSLRKSARRNLTRNGNRLDKEQVKLTTQFFYGRRVDWKTSKEMMSVYAERFLIKNNIDLGMFTKVVKTLLTYFLLRDRITRWLNRTDKNFHAIIYMNNEIAAFTSGVISKDKRIICSRLAIFTKYSRYGPGGVLTRESVKYLSEQNKCGNLDITLLDFSQGGEGGMSYKKSYGGQPHIEGTFSY